MTFAEFSLAPAHQSYLVEARQLQTMSFVMHIPLVCFAIAFPAMALYVEWRYLRTGDEVYLTLARRWSRVVVGFGFAAVRPAELAGGPSG